MKSKIFGLLSLSMLAVLVLASCVSAVDPALTQGSLPSTLTKFSTSTTFTINSTNVKADFTVPSSLVITDGNEHNLTLSISSTETDSTSSSSVSITVTLPSDVGEYLGDYSGVLTVQAKDESSTDTSSINITLNFKNTPNEYIDNNHLNIEDIDLSVENGFGPEDTEWYPLDEIKAKIKVSNDGNEKIKSIKVQWGLYDTENGKWVVKEKEDSFSLNDGDSKTLTVNFQVDPEKIKNVDNTDNYKFYIWATGDDDGTDTSTYYSDDITLDIDDDFVILNNIKFSETASCGSEVQITADVWNIGADDQDDVYVRIYNKELGINQKVTIGDIDAFDNEKLEVTITLPKDAKEKQYDLTLSVYDEDNDVYENDEDDKAEFSVPLTMESGSCSTVPTASITASLQSGAKAGEDLVIKAVIINTGSETKTFSISASGYADWASLGSIDKTSITLDSGKSEEVLIKLNVGKEASGTKTFNIELVEGNKFMSQPVSVSIENLSSFPGLTGLFAGIGGDNWYLWGIGALNVLLVLAIIIVAVKVTKKKE